MIFLNQNKFFNRYLPLFLSVVLVTAALVFVEIKTAPGVHAAFFGYNTIGIHAQSAVDKYGTFVIPSSSGTITDIEVYLNNIGTSGTVDVGIYAGTVSTFTGAVSNSSTQTVSSATPAWYDFTVNASVTAGQGYWLMVEAQSGSGVRFYYDTSPTGAGYTMAYGYTTPGYLTWTTPVTGGSFFTSYAVSIYANYTPSGGSSAPHANMTIYNGANSDIPKGSNMTIFNRN